MKKSANHLKFSGMACVAFAACISTVEARPLKSICQALESFRKLADLKHVKPILRVKPDSKTLKPADITFTIAARSGPIRFGPDADWRVEPPVNEALCAENPDVSHNQAEGSLAFSVSIDPQIPPAKTLDYRQLDALRREWDEAVSRQNIVMRLMAPSAKGYHLQFEPGRPANAEVQLPQGPRRIDADAEGNLLIPLEPSWVAPNPTIVLSEMPRRIGLRFKG
jgi:hypothetical protein